MSRCLRRSRMLRPERWDRQSLARDEVKERTNRRINWSNCCSPLGARLETARRLSRPRQWLRRSSMLEGLCCRRRHRLDWDGRSYRQRRAPVRSCRDYTLLVRCPRRRWRQLENQRLFVRTSKPSRRAFTRSSLDCSSSANDSNVSVAHGNDSCQKNGTQWAKGVLKVKGKRPCARWSQVQRDF